jgi:hypothetical protein
MARISRFGAALGIAALLTIGGGAYALAASRGGTITVCVSHKGGTLYKAKKCKKHDSKLSWGKQGPQGATGAPGGAGAKGATGPQGPGGSILTFDGTATASPTPTTLGTLGDDTWSAECELISGNAESVLFIQTTTGGLDVDFDTNEYASSGESYPYVDSLDEPPGTFPSAIGFAGAEASGASGTEDDHVEVNELAPTPAYLAMQLSADNATDTCHASLMEFPTTLTAFSAAASKSKTAGTSGTTSHPVSAITNR